MTIGLDLVRLWRLCALGLALLAAGVPLAAGGSDKQPPHTYKILYIMSYHSPWRWTDNQLQGFKDAMGGVPAVYRTFQLDAKRNSDPEALGKAARKAMDLIASWKPDLVYTSDDAAQQLVTRHYINTKLPFVFSGVNNSPAAYGFVGAKNVTGVLEQEHFVQSVHLLREVDPNVKRIAVVFDDAPMWNPVRARMEAALPEIHGVRFGPWDTVHTFAEYKRKITAYRGKVDAIALIGIFEFKDSDGKDVPYQDVLRWTAEHSTLPDFSFWIDRVHYGTLCAVTVSGRQQGLAAGRIARAILTEGKSPSSFPMVSTTKGLPVINLKRARMLGIMPSTSVLLSSEVIKSFDWDQP